MPISTIIPFFSALKTRGSCNFRLFLFKYSTKDAIPPSYLKDTRSPLRSSSRERLRPSFRNASSLKRSEIMLKSKRVSLKISLSGLNLIFVPVFAVFSSESASLTAFSYSSNVANSLSSQTGLPRSYFCQ